MKQAQVRLHVGHGDVEITVTPAECCILTHDDSKIGHKVRAGKFPLSNLKNITEAKGLSWNEMTNVYDASDKPRTDKEEYQRLYRKFGKKRVEVVFPASAAKLPETFDLVQGWEDEKDQATAEADGKSQTTKK